MVWLLGAVINQRRKWLACEEEKIERRLWGNANALSITLALSDSTWSISYFLFFIIISLSFSPTPVTSRVWMPSPFHLFLNQQLVGSSASSCRYQRDKKIWSRSWYMTEHLQQFYLQPIPNENRSMTLSKGKMNSASNLCIWNHLLNTWEAEYGEKEEVLVFQKLSFPSNPFLSSQIWIYSAISNMAIAENFLVYIHGISS